ncbi:MAG: DUF1553 domain-containing protein [Planctomycetota bacterium]|nr:MAG: DUF1553 domain-containing protein [Planctomycetota bacterium]REK43245.1 MAG: DUF1553 domain-containing protein [Planctomycetota bacterium]
MVMRGLAILILLAALLGLGPQRQLCAETNRPVAEGAAPAVPEHPSFRNDVQPILAKFGCSSGACHGALAGKGGLKLSLRGYDTEHDYLTITRQARGRRIELADPGRSLLLAKPTTAIPHKGGLRFEVDSYEYQVLARWIAQGATAPSGDDPHVERIEVGPEHSTLQPGDVQQIRVTAFYDDGSQRDVTRWAKYTSANETVAKIDEAGSMAVSGFGEGAVTAWYQSKIAMARVTSPYKHTISASVYAESPRRNFIDDLVLKKLEQLNLAPSPRSGDAEFLRRAYLDTIGTLPTAREARRFLADESPEKRDRLIEDLLARSEFVDYWSMKWSDMLTIDGRRLRPKAVEAYYKWIHKNVEENTPWDDFVRQIVTARGSSYENGATNFYALHQDPENMTENACQAFLGLSIGCAKCHNHPLEKWTNDQYYAMANLFARVRAKGWGGDPRDGSGHRSLFVATKGDLIQPRTGKPQPPTPLDGQPLAMDDPEDRREYLADWMVSPENPYFTRAIVNRVWANYLGVGLVEAVDDLRATNPASNEELLAALCDYLVEEKYDLKSLMRLILQSETYQRTSAPLPENKDEERFYSRYYPRRMIAEVMLDAISQVTGVPSTFTQVEASDGSRSKTEFYPEGTRAIQLYDSAVVSYFLNAFGRNERAITCECERTNEPSIVQVLHIVNGETINKKLQSPQSRVDKLLVTDVTDESMVEVAYLSSLSRYPTEEERQVMLEALAGLEGRERREALEDVYWSLLSSKEFLFHH